MYGTYGIKQNGNGVDLGFVSQGPCPVNAGSCAYLIEDDDDYKLPLVPHERRREVQVPPHAREDSVLEKDWQGTYGIKQNGDDVELLRMIEKENSFDVEFYHMLEKDNSFNVDLLRMLEKENSIDVPYAQEENSFDVDMNNPMSRI